MAYYLAATALNFSPYALDYGCKIRLVPLKKTSIINS
jgi:hypothetical protein